MKRYSTNFTVLKAFNGDCILIKTFNSDNDEFIILIDGGTAATFEYSLKKELKDITKIDLVVLTHIDSDHILGLVKFFKNSMIDRIEIPEIWINHPELIDVTAGELISHGQANTLKNLIIEKKPLSKIRSISINEKEIDIQGIKFSILSPKSETIKTLYDEWEYDKPKIVVEKVNISSTIDSTSYCIELNELAKSPFNSDDDLVNNASISFLLSCLDMKILFLADSSADIIESEIRMKGYNETNKLICNYVKISHHGSKKNTSNTLLGLIDCAEFIISTNGGTSRNKHPSRETIARLVHYPERNFDKKVCIYTNYSISDIKNKIGDFITDEDIKSGNWTIENKNEF